MKPRTPEEEKARQRAIIARMDWYKLLTAIRRALLMVANEIGDQLEMERKQ